MQCNESYHGDCPHHGPLLRIVSKDVDEPFGTTRARESLPDCLYLMESSIPGAGTGVFAKVEIPEGVQFGPYIGDILVDDIIDTGYQWEVFTYLLLMYEYSVCAVVLAYLQFHIYYVLASQTAFTF